MKHLAPDSVALCLLLILTKIHTGWADDIFKADSHIRGKPLKSIHSEINREVLVRESVLGEGNISGHSSRRVQEDSPGRHNAGGSGPSKIDDTLYRYDYAAKETLQDAKDTTEELKNTYYTAPSEWSSTQQWGVGIGVAVAAFIAFYLLFKFCPCLKHAKKTDA